MAEKNVRLAIRRTIDRETPTIDLCETINSAVFAVDVVDACEMYFFFFFFIFNTAAILFKRYSFLYRLKSPSYIMLKGRLSMF